MQFFRDQAELDYLSSNLKQSKPNLEDFLQGILY